MPHPAELRRTFLSYAAPCWATPYTTGTEPLYFIFGRRSFLSFLHMGAFSTQSSKPVFGHRYSARFFRILFNADQEPVILTEF